MANELIDQMLMNENKKQVGDMKMKKAAKKAVKKKAVKKGAKKMAKKSAKKKAVRSMSSY